MIKQANAVWHGNGLEGHGVISTQSELIRGAKYSSKSRFEGEPGASPEELVAAAHASCFAMKLSFNLSGINFPPVKLDVQCHIKMEDFVINESRLVVLANVPGIDEATFQAQVEDARLNCPISKLLSIDKMVEATLEG
ncbi:MAG: OsmC family peroxiredoxin [Flammeovirgaceae bacterium]|jgi:lipoyl-dependent peroxiredoxin|nr:OsmC family peroxiredoxin [Flammeovirgaceae bacterium]|tara:strand:+ start:14401 stop:14814 length:414 start_codon:yes stop_codon:yes gene_type:complete